MMSLDLTAPPKAALRAYFEGPETPEGRRAPADVLAALEQLAAALAKGAEPVPVWALRAELARRYTTATAPWAWPFDHLPTADQGWLADITIWDRCRKEVPEASAFDAVVHTSRSARVIHALALARASRVAEGSDHAAVDGALLSSLADKTPIPTFRPRRVARRGGPRTPIPTGLLGANARRTAASLLATRGAPSGEAVLEAFVAWLVAAHAGNSRAFESLSRLWSQGVPSARAALAEIAAGPSPWPPVTRQRALRLLLIPRTRPPAPESP